MNIAQPPSLTDTFPPHIPPPPVPYAKQVEPKLIPEISVDYLIAPFMAIYTRIIFSCR